MKKLLLLLILTLTAFQPLRADEPSLVEETTTPGIIDTLKNLPAMKQGVAFDIAESEVNYITTVNVLEYKGVGLDLGYSSSNKAVATLNYNIGGLSKLGINTPITNLIDVSVGYFAGYGRITGSNEFSHGPALTLLSVKF